MSYLLTLGIQQNELPEGWLRAQQAIQDLPLFLRGCRDRVGQPDSRLQYAELLLDKTADRSGRIVSDELLLAGDDLALGLNIRE
jgi:hypothetical protein